MIKKILLSQPLIKKSVIKTYRLLGGIQKYFNPDKLGNFVCMANYLPDKYKNYSSFGGYYDKDLINKPYVILNITKRNTYLPPSACEPIKLVVLDLSNKEIVFEHDILSYNWQQGCRAHWVNKSMFVFNNYDEKSNGYYCELYDVNLRKTINRYSIPVQDSFQSSFFLSINYNRLNVLRPDYGYRNQKPMGKEELESLDDDGIFFQDMNNKTNKYLLLSLKTIMEFGDNSLCLSEKIHKANHVMISPDGQLFIFIHRCYPGGKRYDRLLVSDIKGNIKNVLATEMVSHCCWIDNEHVFGYMNDSDGNAGYQIVNVNTGFMKRFEDNLFSCYGDGHPSVKSDLIVTDSYPDKFGFQHLLLYSQKTKKSLELARFYQSYKYRGQCRCDLHPRLSVDGSISLDSVDSGRRQMYILLKP